MNKYISPFFQVILAATIWGSGGIFVKTIGMQSTHLAFFRLGIPTVLVSIRIIYHKHKLFTSDTKKLLIMSSLNALRMRLFFIGYIYTAVANAVVTQYTRPIFVVILAAILLGEKITKKKILAIILACIGILFLYINQEFSLQNNDIIGMLAIGLSAIISAYNNIIFKEVSHKHSQEDMIFYQCFIGAIIFSLFFLSSSATYSLGQVSLASTYALLIGIIGFMLYFHAIQYISIGKANLLSYVEMISAIILAYIVLGEIPEINTILGACFIIGAILSLRKEKI